MTADMVVLRISPPAAPDPATDLLRRCALDAPDGPRFLLVDVAGEDPHRALAAAVVLAVRPGRARLVALAVDPDFRRRGLATRLMSDVRRSLNGAGTVLELCIEADGRLTNILHGLGFAEDPGPENADYAADTGGRRWVSRDT
ncbi:GNAT family N-acetyltransferase [Cryptosporangium phraense]|uniref:GNAT family N-acetyltransferase n=1 Tax=Cryptosporangium phraense TaxID=2593070 RepID=A0A545ALN8_9ACTN|nr:GNAT family N-acetyltransferase [Cryptosporangium phraense]TQS42226.1 GNAT family N-acetyltransferase [Cryptosporangium phraense]